MQQGKFLTMLADVAASRTLPAGHVLFEMGDPASTMYVVGGDGIGVAVGKAVCEVRVCEQGGVASGFGGGE